MMIGWRRFFRVRLPSPANAWEPPPATSLTNDAMQDAADITSVALHNLGRTSETTAPAATDSPYAIAPLWQVDSPAKGKAFLDIQNDVTVADVELALREGYSNVEHVKRYTTAAWGSIREKPAILTLSAPLPQHRARICPRSAPPHFARLTRPWPLERSVAYVKARSSCRTAILRSPSGTSIEVHSCTKPVRAGGVRGISLEASESFQETVNRECKAVREGVGVYDGSPLGKFELKGRDVGQFLDLLYTNIMSTLSPGNGRYGIMLSEDGLIMDDGVVFRLDDHRWLVSTSTGHADAINQHMEKVLQFDHPDWQVFITTVTSQWNNATICGPKAREVMEALGTDIDLSREAFPFMSLRDGVVAGLPARVLRVSFTGELSFEVNVAPRTFA